MRATTILFFITFVLLVMTNCASNSLSHSSSDLTHFDMYCSSFESDEDIVAEFIFTSIGNKYGMDDDEHIISLTLVNTNIPKTLFCLKHLQILYINNSTFDNSNKQLPSEILRFQSTLIVLSIVNCPINSLPDKIGQMKKLQKLEIIGTELTQLPDSVGQLSSLKILLLSNNKLNSLPTTIRQLTSLEYLDVSNNSNLTSLDSISYHPVLQTLLANQCAVKKLPHHLPNLVNLHLDFNQLISLKGIHTLGDGTDQDKFFSFESNRILFVPKKIKLVRKLFHLNLNDNMLTDLMDTIVEAKALAKLYIEKTRISYQRYKAIESLFRATGRNVTIWHSN